MKYLVIYDSPIVGKTAFFTNYYQESNYQPGMIVIDRVQKLITYDGETWADIEEDHL